MARRNCAKKQHPYKPLLPKAARYKERKKQHSEELGSLRPVVQIREEYATPPLWQAPQPARSCALAGTGKGGLGHLLRAVGAGPKSTQIRILSQFLIGSDKTAAFFNCFSLRSLLRFGFGLDSVR